jgi:hypothetical protein
MGSRPGADRVRMIDQHGAGKRRLFPFCTAHDINRKSIRVPGRGNFETCDDTSQISLQVRGAETRRGGFRIADQNEGGFIRGDRVGNDVTFVVKVAGAQPALLVRVNDSQVIVGERGLSGLEGKSTWFLRNRTCSCRSNWKVMLSSP